ncbi:uncharacterized protein yraP [endosymbiont of Sipalinus gigas]|uniref:hypothetical protein n=1 Tax=endosymbiont of Sipalinus gigas TaxID=1972134 RepID=UPI000DC70BBB|nr:hypothetical protein [endosymbiont of Sipalinus gigas]BBA85309.1 uncharacterized protein yraP [endosymbiont of Sipalinus gigas]
MFIKKLIKLILMSLLIKTNLDYRKVNVQIYDLFNRFKLNNIIKKYKHNNRIIILLNNKNVIILGQVKSINDIHKIEEEINKNLNINIINELRCTNYLKLNNIIRDKLTTLHVHIKFLFNININKFNHKIFTENKEIFIIGKISNKNRINMEKILNKINKNNFTIINTN